MSRILITGATGFVGSHVVERFYERGLQLRTIARPTADCRFLQSLKVEILEGDLQDATTLQHAVQDVDTIIHCAAKVGDWGDLASYRAINVHAFDLLLNAAIKQQVPRVIYLSSLGVYAAGHHNQTDESVSLPLQQMDGYTQSKVEAEQLVKTYQKMGLAVTILRPGFIYGPRDRTVLPTVIHNLKQRKVKWIAHGKYALNTTYVGNLIHAVERVYEEAKSIGETYNITDGEFVSKRRFFEVICNTLNLPLPKGNVPLWLAKRLAPWLEKRARKQSAATPPRLTMARLKFLGYNLDFSIAKARIELGYEPPFSFEDGMRITLQSIR